MKVLKFKTWECSDFKNETITFTADQVNASTTFNFFNCEKCKIIIPGKFKNAMFSRCKKSEITLDSTMSMVEVLKSDDVKLFVNVKIPTISIQVCNCAQIIFTSEAAKESSSIETTASQSVSILIQKKEGTYDPNDEEDQPEKLLTIPETYITKVVNDEIVHVPQEALE